jgi:hypothetical protein
LIVNMSVNKKSPPPKVVLKDDEHEEEGSQSVQSRAWGQYNGGAGGSGKQISLKSGGGGNSNASISKGSGKSPKNSKVLAHKRSRSAEDMIVHRGAHLQRGANAAGASQSPPTSMGQQTALVQLPGGQVVHAVVVPLGTTAPAPVSPQNARESQIEKSKQVGCCAVLALCLCCGLVGAGAGGAL